jgi:hypothetical protein
MSTGNLMIAAGTLLILTGIAWKLGLLHWFGNLPGDIKYESGNTKVYFPIVTMIVISIILSILLSLLKR